VARISKSRTKPQSPEMQALLAGGQEYAVDTPLLTKALAVGLINDGHAFAYLGGTILMLSPAARAFAAAHLPTRGHRRDKPS
jgi:hypothetical protein